jgi:hypothetical protein
MAAKNIRTKTLLSPAEIHPKQGYSRAITLPEDAGSLRLAKQPGALPAHRSLLRPGAV